MQFGFLVYCVNCVENKPETTTSIMFISTLGKFRALWFGSTNNLQKNVDLSGIRTWIVGKESKHADHVSPENQDRLFTILMKQNLYSGLSAHYSCL